MKKKIHIKKNIGKGNILIIIEQFNYSILYLLVLKKLLINFPNKNYFCYRWRSKH